MAAPTPTPSAPLPVPPPPPPPVSTLPPTANPTVTQSPSSRAPTKTPTPTAAGLSSNPTPSAQYSVDYSCLHANSWLVNKNNNYNHYFNSWTDITNSHVTGKGKVWSVLASQIPNYNNIFTTANIQQLNSRPKASTDFVTGRTTAVAGRNYTFGTNINYVTSSGSGSGCNLGYWPPGPICPAAQNIVLNFTLTPAPAVQGSCKPSLGGAIGYFVNGVSMYGWSDATTYNNQEVWYNAAGSFEQYDFDPCSGHAANPQNNALGVYHHHTYSKCLAQRLNDTGTKHSPVYGFASDGYPVYGPYQAAGKTLTVSCWQARNYSDPVIGCKGGKRTCLLSNNLLPYGGTTVAKYPGPPLNGTIATQSNNYINSTSGIYYQDYYYNSSCTAVNINHLDQFNGHSHGTYGYHYHVTINVYGTAVFPYTVGPYYYGCMPGLACATCGTSTAKYPGNCTASPTSSVVLVQYPPTVLPSQAPFSPTSTSSSSSSSSSSSGSVVTIVIAVVVVVVGAAVLIAAVRVGYYYYSKKKSSNPAQGGSMDITDVYQERKGKNDSFAMKEV